MKRPLNGWKIKVLKSSASTVFVTLRECSPWLNAFGMPWVALLPLSRLPIVVLRISLIFRFRKLTARSHFHWILIHLF